MAEQERRLAEQRAATAEHSRVFNLLDVPSTLERWIKADMGSLDRIFDAAWDGIIRRGRVG